MMLSVPPSLWCLTVCCHSERGQEWLVEKTGNGNVTRSEESITLMTPYGVLSIYLLTGTDPSRSFRMTFNVSLTMTPYTIRSHSALLADSSQLITFIFLPAFSPRWQILRQHFGWRLTIPRHSERGSRMPCEKDGKQQCDTKRRIYYSDDILPSSLPR